MTAPVDPSTLQDPRDLAAYWFARLRSGEADARERDAFEAWRRADPANARQYARVEALWDAAGELSQAERAALGYGGRRAFVSPPSSVSLLASVSEPASPPPSPSPFPPSVASPSSPVPAPAPVRAPARPAAARRRWLLAGLAGAAAAGVLAFVAPARWLAAPDYQVRAETGRGERRTVPLPDGSMLTLNTDTAVEARFYGPRREVALLRGEALFEVSHAPDRPFVVDAGSGSVTVTGTRFDVRRHADAFSVTVAEGSVRVDSGPWWRRSSAALSAGASARAASAGGIAVARADVDAVLAWREGKLVFDATPLPQAVAEINRYLAQPAVVADPAAGRLRVSGIFDIDDAQALLGSLPRILPVEVRRGADGRAEIVLR